METDHTSHPRIHVEMTLALIKPDAFHKAEEIEAIILKSGFVILEKQMLRLSPVQCSDLYAHQYGKLFFPSLTAFMSSGPIVAMKLACDNAIAHWKSIIGPANSTKAREMDPGCLRAIYGTCDLKNAVHGSESLFAAEREIKLMFPIPNTTIESFNLRESTEEYLNKYVNPTLLRGLTELCKQKPENHVLWFAKWLLENDPNEPRIVEAAESQQGEKVG